MWHLHQACKSTAGPTAGNSVPIDIAMLLERYPYSALFLHTVWSQKHCFVGKEIGVCTWSGTQECGG